MAGTDPTCPTCGKDFDTLRGMRVHHAKTHDEILPNCTCTDCQTVFYDPDSARVYCDDCKPSRERTRDRWTYGNTDGTCNECGATFLYYPSEKLGRYCPDCVDDDSVSCTPQSEDWGDGSSDVICSYCGEIVTVYRSKAENQDNVFCDRDCYSKWLADDRRDNRVWERGDNPNWEGGVIADEHYGEGWPSARTAALARDGFRCRRCGRSRRELGRNPDVHHIEPVRTFDDHSEAHVLENLISLCRPCHLTVERDGVSLEGMN